jgi:hypothetical protein
MEAVQLALTREGAVRFEVLARPRSHAERIAAVRGGALVVHLTAAPADGAANEQLVATLAQALSVPKRHVSIARGASSRTKLVDVLGLSVDEVARRLASAVG